MREEHGRVAMPGISGTCVHANANAKRLLLRGGGSDTRYFQSRCSSNCHPDSKKTLSNSRVETKASSFLLSLPETFAGCETIRCKLRKTNKVSKQHQHLQ